MLHESKYIFDTIDILSYLEYILPINSNENYQYSSNKWTLNQLLLLSCNKYIILRIR